MVSVADTANEVFDIVRFQELVDANKMETFSLDGVFESNGGSINTNVCSILGIKVFSDNQGSNELDANDGLEVDSSIGVYSLEVNLKDNIFEDQ